MNYLFAFSLIASSLSVFGGESSLTTTYQPLNGLGVTKIFISAVACHDWYSHSGYPTAIGLISVPNVPPTNNPKGATQNLNLASVCGVYFYTSDIGDPKAALGLTMDVTKFAIPNGCDHPREDIIRACLECLRRCLPEKLIRTPLTLKASDKDSKWMSAIVHAFNAHDRSTVYYSPPS